MATAAKSSAPKRNNAARVFGYDVFLSFALGPPPRGTHSYASDLARRLRERDFTVFFSEDEASPGERLDSTLVKALDRSRILVVIANRSTLEEPRWVRQEVEEFRRRHPDRPVIPISVGGALQYTKLSEQTQWMECQDKIWLDESDEAVANGIASDGLVERLALAPAGRSSNVKWRWLVRTVVAGLVVLAVAATGFGIYAKRQKEAALTNARESRARELTAYATGSLGEDPERSILLAMHGVNATLQFGQSPVPAAEDLLHRAIMSSQVRQTLRGHNGVVNSVAWSPDGKRLATGNGDGTAKVWDAESGKELLTLRGHLRGVNAVAFRPDGKRLATTSGDGTAKVWDAESGQELLTLNGHSYSVSGVGWSPADKRLATASGDGTAKVWDAATGEAVLTLDNDRSMVSSVAWSPGGQRLATGSGGGDTAKVWDAATGKEVLTLSGHSGFVLSVAWSPDGRQLATASGDKTVKVWDAESGKELLTVLGHSDAVTGVAYSRDGKRLATASDDGTAKVWDALNGQELQTLRGHKARVKSVAWSPDGKRLATASDDQTAKVWNAATGEEFLLSSADAHESPFTGCHQATSSGDRVTRRSFTE